MFSTYELSRFLGRKIALYRFTRDTVAWRFTNADRPITVGSETFVPCRGIQHSEVQETTSSSTANQVKVSMAFALDPAAKNPPPAQAFGGNFRPYPPSQRIFVAVLTMHYGDPDSQLNVDWVGRVLAPSFTDTTMTLACDPSYRNSRTGGRMPRIGRSCDVPMYSQGLGMCNLDKSVFGLTGTLTAVSGAELTAAEFGTATRSLAGGFLQWTRADELLDRRTIIAHSGSVVTVNYGALEFAPGLLIGAFPGCAHNASACNDYGNLENYPGFVNLPSQDPLVISQYSG